MKLTSKITEKRLPLFISFIIVTGMLIFFLPIIYFSISQVSSNGESTFTKDEVVRAENVFHSELDGLSSSLLDYAGWDDTFEFAQDGNQEYIDNNLSDYTIANINVDLVLILNVEKKLIFGKYVERSEVEEQPIPFELNDLFAKYPALLENETIESSHLGYGELNGVPLMIASRPITNSQFTGDPDGTMIFIRILDENLLQQLSELTMRQLSLFPAHSILLGTTNLPAYSELQDQAYIQTNNARSISGFKYLRDINGEPTLILEVENPRILFLQGQKSFAITSGAFLLLGIILFYAVYRFTGSFIQSRKATQNFLARFQSVVNQSQDSMLQVDHKGQIISINPSGEQLLGWKLNESEIGILDSILSFDPSLNEEYILNLCQSGKIAEHHCARNDGQEFDIEMSATFIPDAQHVSFSIVLRDISKRKKAENELKVSEERYMLAANGANDGLWDWNYLTGEIYYSKRWKMMLGFSEDEIKSSPDEWFDRVHPEDIIRLHKKISNLINRKNDIFKSEHRVMKKDGHYCWMMSRGIAVRDSFGNVTRIAGSQTDITDRKNVEEQLRHDALHDGLTGLANRLLLINNLTLVNERKKRNPELMFALLFLDLDRFKQVNDTYGHAAGDYVLIEASRRLDAAIRSSDSAARFTSSETLSRIAGDEFVILLEDFKENVDVHIIYQRLAEELNSPYYYHGNEIRLSASYGLVIPETPYDNVEDIIRDADIAMYRAKQLGGSQVVQFNQGMYQGTLVRMQLESDMRKGLEQNEFELYYQPIYDLTDNRISGFEALIRWNHPERGLLLPGEFIQIAEETGLIVPMGYFVIEEACRRMQSWKEGAITTPDISISVNISAKQLLGTNLVPKIQEILAKTSFDANSLWLELTESIVVEFNAEVIECLKTIRAMGIHIVIDDFGTGYSSLSYLQNLPVDGFKIDRSFTSDIQDGGQQIIRSLVDLGHSLGLMQVAEGVETQFQKDYLTSLSCDYAQGFLMSRPMNAGAIEELVKALSTKESPQTIQNM